MIRGHRACAPAGVDGGHRPRAPSAAAACCGAAAASAAPVAAAAAAHQSDRRSDPEAVRLALDRPRQHGRPRRRHRGRREQPVDHLRRLRDRRHLEDAPTTARPGRRSSTTYPVSSIGDIAIAPSNPDIIYVGTGEPNNRQSSSFGAGVYKSTDAGKTFEVRRAEGNAEHRRASSSIRRIPNIVYVAARRPPVRAEPGARPLQDDRRRQDLDEHEVHRQRHRLHRRRDGSVEPERALRRVVPAAPDAVGLQRRRRGQRHLEDDRRRQDLDAADRQRPARQPDHRPHRPRHRALEAVARSTPRSKSARAAAPAPGVNDDGTLQPPRQGAWRRRRWWPRQCAAASARSEEERHLAIGRRRQDVAVRVEPRRSLDVLQPDPRRSRPTRRSRTRAARRSSRPSTAARPGAGAGHRAQRSPRDLDQPAERQPHPARQRRRPRRQLRPGGDLGVREHRRRSASSTQSAPTCGSRTTCAAGCRTTAAGAARAPRAARTAS